MTTGQIVTTLIFCGWIVIIYLISKIPNNED